MSRSKKGQSKSRGEKIIVGRLLTEVSNGKMESFCKEIPCLEGNPRDLILLSETEIGSVTRIDLRHWKQFWWNCLQPRKFSGIKLLHSSPTTNSVELIVWRGKTFTDTNKLGPQYVRSTDHAIFPPSMMIPHNFSD